MFLLVFLLIGAVDAQIQWSFASKQYNFGVFLDATIGTPGQQVKLRLSQDSRYTFLGVPSIHNPYGGTFNPNKSSTFHQTGTIDTANEQGISGTDDFVINGVKVSSMPFNVYTQGQYYGGSGEISLAYSDDADSNFIQAVLKTQKQNIAVVTYDQVRYANKPGKIRGTLTLGEVPKECGTQWTIVQEFPQSDSVWSWAFQADMLTVGKYQHRNPGIIWIAFDESGFSVPESMVDTIARAVGVLDSARDTLPCDTDTKIVLTTAGFNLTVGPETYIARNSDPDEVCTFQAGNFGDSVVNYYELPVGVLKDICIRYNYSTNEVGFAPKLE